MRLIRAMTLSLLLTGCASAPPSPEPVHPATTGWSGMADGRPAAAFFASCAAALAQKVMLIPSGEREASPELYAGIGRYVRLSCVASSPDQAHVQYLLEREKASGKTAADLGACAGEPNCVDRVHKDMDALLMRCVAYQRQNAGIIAGLAPATVAQCAKDKL